MPEGLESQARDRHASAGSGEAGRRRAEDTSVLELLSVVVKRWKVIVAVPLIAGVLAILIALMLQPLYTAGASFLPEGDAEGINLSGGLSGLAAQFGVRVPGGGGTSPEFYSALVTSRTLRDQLLVARFPDPRGQPGDSIALIDLLEVEGETRAQRLERGRERLRGMTSTAVNDETGVVSVSVETPYPSLSANVANHLVELVNRFNLETRKTRAHERRRFVEDRVEAATDALWESEEALKRFLEQNRQWQGAPELVVQHGRLDRQVSRKQEVLAELQRVLEQARIHEVNNTPVITTIDLAVPPEEKSRPRRRLIVILAVIGAGALGVSLALGSEFLERARRQDEQDYRELTSQWGELRADIRSLARKVMLRS